MDDALYDLLFILGSITDIGFKIILLTLIVRYLRRKNGKN